MEGNSYTYDAIQSTVESYRQANRGGKIGLISGTFDILHPGHVNALSECKKKCDFLIVSITPDKKVGKFKVGRPYNKQDDRAYMINNLKPVDATVISLEKDNQKQELIGIIKPDVYFLGPDQKDKQSSIVNVDRIDLPKNMSTTDIIERIVSAENKRIRDQHKEITFFRHSYRGYDNPREEFEGK